jgi:hypothetical protein
VKRSDLAHILRAACDVTNDPEIVVIGSQAILATFDEEELPSEVIRSIEAEVAFLNDPNEQKSDAVDGAIGEESPFHETHGIYGQGVSISTAILPSGWEERLIAFDSHEAGRSKAVCLDVYDLVASKLAAGREKDFEFAHALLAARLIRVDILLTRATLLPGPGSVSDRVIKWISGTASG